MYAAIHELAAPTSREPGPDHVELIQAAVNAPGEAAEMGDALAELKRRARMM